MLYKLDLFGGDGSGLGTINIAANNGTKADGFGWDFFGLGKNTGGFWEWNYIENFGFTIDLYNLPKARQSFPFGSVEADWKRLNNPNGYPPQPWFSPNGINAGMFEFIETADIRKIKWRLRQK